MTKLAAQGIKFLSIYFAGDGFIEYSDSPWSSGSSERLMPYSHTHAGSDCLYGIAEITQNFDRGTNNYSTHITLQKDLPTPCGALK